MTGVRFCIACRIQGQWHVWSTFGTWREPFQLRFSSIERFTDPDDCDRYRERIERDYQTPTQRLQMCGNEHGSLRILAPGGVLLNCDDPEVLACR